MSARVRFLDAVGRLGFSGHFDAAAELRQLEFYFGMSGVSQFTRALRILNRIDNEHAREAVEALCNLLEEV